MSSSLELITIGTELLLGFTLDTNGAEIGRALANIGVRITRRTSVSDDPDAIRDAVSGALARTGMVLTTGGLGPTADDITKRVVAEFFGMPLDFQQEIWESIVARFTRIGRVPSAANRSQAEVPRGGTVLPNRWGTAPGLWLEGDPGIAIMLPGVPTEMRMLLEHEVVPRLSARADGTIIRSRTIRTAGIAESSLAERIGPIEEELKPLSLAYLPGTHGVDLRVTSWNLPAAEADRRLLEIAVVLRQRAGEFVFGEDDDDLARLVLDAARAARVRIATAESCTGGLVGGRLTAIPGSSDVFVGGIIAYDDAVKREQLGVPSSLLAQHGAVSEAVARAMAEGAAALLGVEASVAVTGIAGPGGGTEEKPVGLVWFAVSVKGVTSAARFLVPGNREDIRARAAQMALFNLRKALISAGA
ncbi:MAG: competence/damage-inducible protein A [Gemmatimonadota bacterium]